MADPNKIVNQRMQEALSLPLSFPHDGSLTHQKIMIDLKKYVRGNPREAVNDHESAAKIVLPLPMSGLSDNVSLQYQEVPLGAIGGFLGSMNNNAMKTAEAVGVEFGQRAITSLVGLVGDAIGDVVGEGGKKAGLPRTGAAVANSIKTGAKRGSSALGQGLGVASNPNLSLSFMGVNLREHIFSWRLIAKSDNETRAIFNIVETLRRYALPQMIMGASLTFGYPCVALISFTPEKLIAMSKLGCFIDSVSATYDGDGHPAFYKGTDKPVIVDLSIRFRERGVLTSEDFGESAGFDQSDATTQPK